jgi:hypothetical protein
MTGLLALASFYIGLQPFGIKNNFAGIASPRQRGAKKEAAMRYLLSIPFLAVVIVAYILLAQAGQMIDPLSAIWNGVLPSGDELFLMAGDIFVIFGLIGLFFEILKAARLSASTILDHMLSTATFIGALIAFLLLPGCGTSTFLMLTLMALIDVVAGYSVSILTARRDLNVSHSDGNF